MSRGEAVGVGVCCFSIKKVSFWQVENSLCSRVCLVEVRLEAVGVTCFILALVESREFRSSAWSCLAITLWRSSVCRVGAQHFTECNDRLSRVICCGKEVCDLSARFIFGFHHDVHRCRFWVFVEVFSQVLVIFRVYFRRIEGCFYCILRFLSLSSFLRFV